MGKASSAKRVAKVAQSSSRTKVRGGQHLGFYSIVALVVLLGSLLVAYGRHTGSANASTPPIVFKDHWHAAYGIYACDKFLAPITNTEDFIPPNQDQTVGVHSHGDGVVHIHPFMSIASGRNAKLGVFFKVESIKASNTKFELPEGLGTFKNGDDCGGKPGTWKLAVWDDANATADPKIYITDFANVRFTKDRMAMTLAFVNSDTDLKTLKPPSIPQLDKLTDLGTDTTTATTAAGTATTAAGTATTVAGDGGSSTTVAGASTTVGAGATSTTLG